MTSATSRHNYFLLLGGWFSLAFAIFQLTAIFWDRDTLQWFGGPVDLMLHRYWAYVALCVIFGVLAAVMGWYALSAAGIARKLPFLRTALVIVALIYLLRGLIAIPQAPIVWRHPEFARYLVFSLVALMIGIVHTIGMVRVFRHFTPHS